VRSFLGCARVVAGFAGAVLVALAFLSMFAWAQDPPGSRIGLPSPASGEQRGEGDMKLASVPSGPVAKARAAGSRDAQPVSSASGDVRRGRRDPFLRPDTAAPGVPRCAGKACLTLDDLLIRGVVRSPRRNFAIVADAGGQVYFLAENDVIRGGVVEQIAADGIVFRMQAAGRAGQRVVRRLADSAGAIDGTRP